MTLKQALDEYVSVYMAYRNFADRTRVEYQNDIEDLVGYLERSGVKKVRDLELRQMERYLAHLENRGFAGATRKRKTVSIRSFLSFLYTNGYIASNIAKHLIPPFADNKQPIFLTVAEYNRLRTASAGNVRDAAIVELLLQTGIRLSELTGLTIDDIEFTGDVGSMRIKSRRGRKERIIPLNTKACEALRNHLHNRPNTDSTSLFLNRFIEPIKDIGIQKMLRKYFGKAGIERASVHTLRHTFGIHHVVKGTSVKTLKEVMGHKDVRSTQLYLNQTNVIAKKEIEDNTL